jgi:hypothetical protein
VLLDQKYHFEEQFSSSKNFGDVHPQKEKTDHWCFFAPFRVRGKRKKHQKHKALNKTLVVLFLLIFSIQAHSQVTLDYFNANEDGKTIFLKWAVSEGQTCNGITITRSSDGFFFEEIGRIEGVCGSPDVSVPYSFTDDSPIANQINYYKLELGVSDFSETISIEYNSKNEEGYQIRPNPVRDFTTIYFDNPNFDEVNLLLFDSYGRQVDEFTSKSSFIEINASSFSDGMYFFLLESRNQTIKGKFLKAD